MKSKITSKGQLTLPKRIRDRLKLKPGNKVEFILDHDGQVRMIPVKSSLKDLKGMLPKPSRPVSLEEMENAIKSQGQIE